MHGSFILSTKRGLSIRVLLGISSGVTTFCLDAVYWDGWKSASSLVNSTNLSTTEQMSDGDTMLIGSGCFPGCLRPGSFAAEGAGVESACTEGACTGGTCVRGTYGGGASTRGACIGGACACDGVGNLMS